MAQETVVLVVVRRSHRQKANKLKLVKQCGRQASKIKALRFEMFLKWGHSAPILHYAANFIGRGQSRKFKAWFHEKKSIRIQFFGLNTFFDVIEIPKPQKPCWPYRHFKSKILKKIWTKSGIFKWDGEDWMQTKNRLWEGYGFFIEKKTRNIQQTLTNFKSMHTRKKKLFSRYLLIWRKLHQVAWSLYFNAWCNFYIEKYPCLKEMFFEF